MYEKLLTLADGLNEEAFLARLENKISHELFVSTMEFVSWLIDEAEKEKREEEID